MAKVVKSPYIKSLSGKAANINFRTKRNGVIEIGKKRIPTNPRSQKQREIRRAYGVIYQLWVGLSEQEKQQYNEKGKKEGLSGWNIFLREQMGEHTVTLSCLETSNPTAAAPDSVITCKACNDENNANCWLNFDDRDTSIVFVKFNLNIPSLAKVKSATLSFNVRWDVWDDWFGPGWIFLCAYSPATDWDSETLTWNNMPARQDELGCLDVEPEEGNPRTYYEYDVTSYIQQQVAAGENKGFRIDFKEYFDTANYGYLYNAKLTVVYSYS